MTRLKNLPYLPPNPAINSPNGYRGYPSKSMICLYSKFKNVMVLDADCTPIEDPTFLFNSRIYLENNNIFWRDMWDRTNFNPGQFHNLKVDNSIYSELGLTRDETTYDNESGIFLVNMSNDDIFKAMTVSWILNNVNCGFTNVRTTQTC